MIMVPPRNMGCPAPRPPLRDEVSAQEGQVARKRPRLSLSCRLAFDGDGLELQAVSPPTPIDRVDKNPVAARRLDLSVLQAL